MALTPQTDGAVLPVLQRETVGAVLPVLQRGGVAPVALKDRLGAEVA